MFDYIKNFKWDDNKFHRGRSLVEIAGVVADVLIKFINKNDLENEKHRLRY